MFIDGFYGSLSVIDNFWATALEGFEGTTVKSTLRKRAKDLIDLFVELWGQFFQNLYCLYSVDQLLWP